MTARLSLDGVTKRFGTTEAVRNVSLTLHDGEFMALLGASGCGKSTTLRLLAGLEAPSAGRVLLNGRDVTRDSAAARNIALMFQSYALYPHLTVFQNIALPLRMRGLSAVQRLPGTALVSPVVRKRQAQIKAQVSQVAEMLRLGDLLARKPGQLSGGQQQRVALARALVREPSAFLLDEPLSNLDTQLRADTRDEIRALHRRTGYPFLLVTHDQSDALSMADRIAVMIAGEIVQVGSPKEIFHRPQSIAVAEFIGHHRINLLPPGPAGRLHPAGTRLWIGIRPEDLRLSPEGALAATVESRAFHGEETILKLRDDAGTALRIVLRGGETLPNPGDTVRLAANPAALHGFGADGRREDIPA
ncbi:carbohydrate ABC transporter ATP-binding protein (CUT1 family) [Rhodovulum bhavnagarense]|uniref:Carbohydrate ABC transporter ATP-binding protein (CUT1 family) n=1 Tax=Rhodovulum bhavnagarense TaxID=992286 RepID=A0A4V2SVK4_9RHOB|nr:ABC transporter ATP-binding protein [Rhodovulum bhavnagarense]TCP58426.1 carbohydrate ABC transporter ATP-binding protein (CUT1 family) [Rhodovulum bhavnagarense]